MKLPKHISFSLLHNDFATYHETAAQAISNDQQYFGDEDWVNSEQKTKAIETNEIWTAQWYPRTSVGFYVSHAADLDVLLKHLEEFEDDD